MDFDFESDDLKRLYETGEGKEKYPSEVVKAYMLRMVTIAAAVDERAFYAMKSLHFEKLKGDREGQHSMMLNDQWRLIVRLEGEAPRKVVVIIGIKDYH